MHALSNQIVLNFPTQHHKKLCNSVSEIEDCFLAGNHGYDSQPEVQSMIVITCWQPDDKAGDYP